MEFEVDTVGNKHRGSAASDDTIGSLLSATLANLVLQPNSDIDSINTEGWMDERALVDFA